jgi:DNA-binding response OmpR family regulator
MKRILLIEDDADIALSVKYNLERDGNFQVTTVQDGESGVREATRRSPDLVLLDLNLPGMEGLDVCRALRQDGQTAAVPIIMLTARVDETDKVTGLELGADDYVTKPFSIRELVARVRAVLRRHDRAEETEPVRACGPLVVNPASRKVEVDGRPVALTRKEFDLLITLMEAGGRVLGRDRLLENVWGYSYAGESRTVDVHVRKLRKKLGEACKDMIETVVGVGYRFRGED